MFKKKAQIPFHPGVTGHKNACILDPLPVGAVHSD
jgi:hypothetical protein